jgi:hypothetical protein
VFDGIRKKIIKIKNKLKANQIFFNIYNT